MQKRIGKVLVCSSLVVCLMAGLTSFGGAETTLSLWDQKNSPKEREAVEYIIGIFEKEYPEVKITRRIMPNLEADQMVRMAFAGGTPPDLSECQDPYTMVKYFQKGLTMDLTEWYKEYGDRYPLGVKSAMNFDGYYIAVPMAELVTMAVFYNKKLLADLGLTEPENYGEFCQALEAAKARGLTPIPIGTKAGWPGLHIYQHFLRETVGAATINDMIFRTDPNKGPRWTDPGFVRAAKYVDEMRQNGYFSKGAAMSSFDAGKMEWLGGRGPFFITGSWVPSFDFPPGFEWDFFWFPHIVGELGYYRNDDYIDLFASLQVSSTTSHPELCLDFLEVWTRPEVQHKAWFEIANFIPVVKGAAPEEELSKFQKAQLELSKHNTGTYHAMDCWMPPAVGFGALYSDMTALFAGEITPIELGKHMEKVHVEELKKLQE